MTPEEIRLFIAGRLLPKIRNGFTETDFLDAWNALGAAGRQAIIGSAIAGNTSDAGQHIEAMLNNHARTKASDRATQITADGTLNAAEFSEVFG